MCPYGRPAGLRWVEMLEASHPVPGPDSEAAGRRLLSLASAGGLVDGLSAARAREGGIDVRVSLARNDSHTALQAMGDLVVTGITGTNVADLRVVLAAG